jgi:oxygen-independent coproporphyrinogen-3 oxidase
VEKQPSVVQRTVDAIRADIIRSAPALQGRKIDTVFFGGGTPTYLSGDQLVSILETVCENYIVSPDAEISSEANPGSSDAAKFDAMYRAGFNRISIGVQSFDDNLLTALDRFHTASEAQNAMRAARSAGFENINLDLMFGLPRQTLSLWIDTLDKALGLQPEHLSLYALTLEPGTLFERRHSGGKLPLPDEDTELEMYDQSIALLRGAGYEHYEVSNFAKPGYRCRHNIVYWNNGEYLGIGPGAVSYICGRRYKRERIPGKYAAKVETITLLDVESECLDRNGALGETMMLGLRLREGIDTGTVAERFGIDPLTHYSEQIERLVKDGLLIKDIRVLRLTHRGLLLANTVLSEFL